MDTMQNTHNFFWIKHTTWKKFQDFWKAFQILRSVVGVEKCEKHWINTQKCVILLFSFSNFMVVHICTIIFNEFSSSKFYYIWKPHRSEVRAFELEKICNSRMSSIETQIEEWMVLQW